ncbi:MAG: NADPH-dependent FMN reductase [Kordia sp.]|nr:MAG: NADPH-dependent FMN reductase [Kordia sp.]
MKKVIALGGSNSKKSINKILAAHAANMLKDTEVKVLDLNNYELPLYGIDLENENGIPKDAHNLLKEIKDADGIVLSLAEHNGAYSTSFKNAFDWLSRIDGKLWSEKPMLLMATSPGARGGATVLEIARGRFPYMGGNIVADVSFPSFFDNFKEGVVADETLNKQLKVAVGKLQEVL